MDFDGRTALITGAAGDIGTAIARLLVARGARVVLADLPAQHERALELATELCSGARPDAHVMKVDVTDADGVGAAIAAAPPIDLVVNNAGWQGTFANVVDIDDDEFARVMSVNVVGAFHVLKSSAQAMVAGGRPGAIVNTASMAGVSGAPNMAAYSASKAAVIGLTKSAAKDLAPMGIRVNAVSPGFIGEGAMWDRQVAEQARVASPYFADDPAEVTAQMLGMIPLGRAGSLREVAEVVAFLLSDAASFLTGINVEIAGGSA